MTILAYLIALFFLPAALGEVSLILIVLAGGAWDWAATNLRVISS